MRELVLKMSMSLDGFASDLESKNLWMYGSDQEAVDYGVAATWNASLHIMGSRSFEVMAPFYPTSTIPFAPPMKEIPKAVISKRGPAVLTAATAASWLTASRICGLAPSDSTSAETAANASSDVFAEVVRHQTQPS